MPAPATGALAAARAAAEACTNCELYRPATQTVFGSGAPGARLMLVGEQPGDREDRAGEPFVGPAGRLLDEALAAAGIDAGDTYVTNVVKHFRFETRGTLRLHKKPALRHVDACRPWLDQELRIVGPEVVVALGATAARALLGPDFSVMADHGTLRRADDGLVLTGTVHPAAVLRAADRRPALFAMLADDLRAAAGALAPRGRQAGGIE